MKFKKALAAIAVTAGLLGSSMSYAQTNTVNVALNSDQNLRAWITDVAKNYEATHPGTKIKFHVIAGSEDNYYTKLALMVKTDTDIDVIYEDSFMLRSDVDAGMLAPLPGADKWKGWEQFYPSLQKAVSLDGKIYSYPLSTDTRGLYYNQNLLKKAGIAVPWHPKSWSDVIAAARAIHKTSPSVVPLSFNVAANGEGTSMQTTEMLLYGTNSPLYKNGKWVVTSQGLLDSLKFVDTVYRENLGPRLGLVMNSQYSNILTKTMAPNQQVGIILDGAWLSGIWTAHYPKVMNNYKLTPMPTQFGQKPGHVTMSGGWGLAMSSKSTNRQQTLDFMHYALNKQNMLNYSIQVKNLATRKDVTNMKNYPQILKQPGTFLKFAHFRPANENYPVVSSYLQTAIESVATGENTPLAAMNRFAASVQRSLGSKAIIKDYKAS